jgi:zinc protease
VRLARTARLVMDDAVQLPRVYLGWHSPAAFAAGDAALDVAANVLTHGRASRLHRALVHDLELAQEVDAFQRSGVMGSTFHVVSTARPGVTAEALEAGIRTHLALLADNGVEAGELERARNVVVTSFVDALQTMGGFGGRADRLNFYAFHTGDPNGAARDLDRYLALDTSSVTNAFTACTAEPDVVLHVVPRAGGAGS